MNERDFVDKLSEMVCPNEKYVQLSKVFKLVEEKFTYTNYARNEIAALADLIDNANLGVEFLSYKDIAIKLRQLSAV